MVVTVTHSKRQWSPTSSHKALHALYGKAPPAPPGSKLNWVSIWKTLFRSCNKIQTRRNHYVKSSDRQISMTTRATAMTQYKICNDLVQAQAPAPARCYHTKKKKKPVHTSPGVGLKDKCKDFYRQVITYRFATWMRGMSTHNTWCTERVST